ncbi:MAG: hypothetical protein R2786_05275 [Flavobacteriaceae bacterium]
MNTAKKNLSEISSVLLHNKSSFGETFQALKSYKALLQKATSLDFDIEESRDNIYTDSGKAIGPSWANLCVDDMQRTQKFCSGLYKAVVKKRSANPNQKVHILYAGTGPFATLILPLTTVFTSSEITFTLLEINTKSFHALQETLAYFEIEEYISKLENVDATTYHLPSKSIDIVVVEAMMFSLKGEHQVPIVYNLIKQLPNETILIPEDITLYLLAVNSERRHYNKITTEAPIAYCKRLGTLFKLNKDEIRQNSDSFFEAFPFYEFEETSIEIPKNIVQNYNELHVETRITIFDDEILEIDESGLTVLDKIHQFKSMMQPSKYLVSKYMCGQNPGLYFRFEN